MDTTEIRARAEAANVEILSIHQEMLDIRNGNFLDRDATWFYTWIAEWFNTIKQYWPFEDILALLAEVDRLAAENTRWEEINEAQAEQLGVAYEALAAKEDLYSKSTMLSADLLNKLTAKDELLKRAVEDIKCKDHCDVCKFSREGEEDCTKYDFDCAKCQSRKCVCRTCRNESKWQWRGKKGDG